VRRFDPGGASPRRRGGWSEDLEAEDWRARERHRAVLERQREAELSRLGRRPLSPRWRPSQPWGELPPGAPRAPGLRRRFPPGVPLDLDPAVAPPWSDPYLDLDPGAIDSPWDDLAESDGWSEDLEAEDFGGALRSSLREEYADASDAEMGDAVVSVLGSMSPAEGFNFASALNRIGKSASQLVSDPTFASIAGTALPILGGAAGTLVGGPAGTAVGTSLGRAAASALPARAAPLGVPARQPTPTSRPVGPSPAPAPPVAATPAPGTPALTASALPSPGPAPAVAGGSAAAAQGLVLTQQPDVLRSLLAAALGEHGRKEVSGVPVAHMLELVSDVFRRAASDADELMYLEHRGDDGESVPGGAPAASLRSLYADLLGADNFELAEAAVRDGLDP
jgi:hypothetical protein